MPKTPHSSLNLSSICSGHASREIPLDRRRPNALGLVDRHVDHMLPADGDPQPVAAGPADDPRRHARRRRPLQHRRHIVGRRRTRRRATPIRRRAPRPRSCARPRRATRVTIDDTSAPMPPVSKQHSASVTARPPSEQSCADRISRCVGQRHEQRLQRALGVEIQRRRHAAHQIVHHLQILAAAQLAAPLAEQDDDVARPWKRRLTTRSACSSRPTTPMTGVG